MTTKKLYFCAEIRAGELQTTIQFDIFITKILYFHKSTKCERDNAVTIETTMRTQKVKDDDNNTCLNHFQFPKKTIF